MTLAGFLRDLPSRLFQIDEDLFRDVGLRFAQRELDALADLALEGALARRSRGEPISPMMVSALVRVNTALEAAEPAADAARASPQRS